MYCVNWKINCAYDNDGIGDIIVAMNSSVIIVIYVRFILRVITAGNSLCSVSLSLLLKLACELRRLYGIYEQYYFVIWQNVRSNFFPHSLNDDSYVFIESLFNEEIILPK